jgi:hypothetical protein
MHGVFHAAWRIISRVEPCSPCAESWQTQKVLLFWSDIVEVLSGWQVYADVHRS